MLSDYNEGSQDFYDTLVCHSKRPCHPERSVAESNCVAVRGVSRAGSWRTSLRMTRRGARNGGSPTGRTPAIAGEMGKARGVSRCEIPQNQFVCDLTFITKSHISQSRFSQCCHRLYRCTAAAQTRGARAQGKPLK